MATLLVLDVVGGLPCWRDPPCRSSGTVSLGNTGFFIEVWVEMASILVEVSADGAADFLPLPGLATFAGTLLDAMVDGFCSDASLLFAISAISFKNCVFFDPGIGIENPFSKR